MRRLWVGTGSLLLVAALGHAQTSLAELDATQQGMNDLNSAQTAPAGGQIALDRAQAVAAPGAVGGASDPALGLAPPPPMGLPAPVGGPAAAPAAFPGLGAQPAFQQPGQPGGVATPTPIPEISVLKGPRVYDAVTNALLEDPAFVTVPQSEQDKYFDDGSRDNGIANDGVRGDSETIKAKFIGPETNSIKNRTLNLVRNAENLTPMVFFGYHFMAVDLTTQHRDMPNLLQKETQQDELLRDWNARFLADFRKDKNDPRSEFYELYVPEPPRLPRFPVPPGYVAPQKLKEGQTPAPGGVMAPAAAPGGYDPSMDPALTGAI